MKLRNGLFSCVLPVSLVAAACSAGSHPPTTPTTGAGETPPAVASAMPSGFVGLKPAHSPGASRSAEVSLGPEVTQDATTLRIPARPAPDRFEAPVAAWGDWIVLSDAPSKAPTSGSTQTFALLNLVTGERQHGWEAPPDTQENVADQSGDWLLLYRSGLGNPQQNWQLILRNLETGDVREISREEPDADRAPNLRAGPQYDFGTSASMSGTRVVWTETVLDPAGRAQKQIEMYDLTDEQRSTLATADLPVEDISGPSIAGGTVAWVHRPAAGAREIVVSDLATNRRQAYAVDGEVAGCVLSSDGQYLAWDQDNSAKHVRNLAMGDVQQYAGDEGWGTQGSGHFVSWQPSTVSYAPNTVSSGAAGFYDFKKQEVRFVAAHENSEIITAHVFGDGFVWQDRSSAPWTSPPPRGPLEPEGEYFYFLKLGQ